MLLNTKQKSYEKWVIMIYLLQSFFHVKLESKKPNPEAFQTLLQKLKLPASSVLFIDDRIENVEAARKQGIDSIQFISPEQLKEELEKRGFDLS